MQALVALRVNPAEFIGSLLDRWPIPSASGAMRLVRRSGDQLARQGELALLKPTRGPASATPTTPTSAPTPKQ